jgi:23S rRNA pseudouridine2605 synthase
MSSKKEEGMEQEKVRLNKFIANAGVCSRRDADELIKEGKIKINGKVVTEMGYKVSPTDTVEYGRKTLSRQKFQYVLLNKPKGFITTMDDEKDRRTVMDLIAKATTDRVYPVGRLDRETMGLLLFTNDGKLAEKLSHPSHKVKKVYQMTLNKDLTQEHFEKIKAGFDLEDGPVKVDELAYVGDAREIGIELHIGRNRIVRRIFEHFGYQVDRLDRVYYAGLTKKAIARGKWRLLEPKEVMALKNK